MVEPDQEANLYHANHQTSPSKSKAKQRSLGIQVVPEIINITVSQLVKRDYLGAVPAKKMRRKRCGQEQSSVEKVNSYNKCCRKIKSHLRMVKSMAAEI